MSEFRYAQFCPIARATEILGERWTLLILRELGFGPKRFADLLDGLPGISRSVLTDRLQSLAERGLVEQVELPPPAAATVYQAGPAGRALAPVMLELVRWGIRFLDLGRDDDYAPAEFVSRAFGLFAGAGPTPAVTLEVRSHDERRTLRVVVQGGDDGTSVTELAPDAAAPDADAVLAGRTPALLRAAARLTTVEDALVAGALEVQGRRRAARRLPELFDFPELFSQELATAAAPRASASTRARGE